MRLIDFQISLGMTPGSREKQEVFPGVVLDVPTHREKQATCALFPVFEAIRLWLKERKAEAPFRKILITLDDASVASGIDDRNCSAAQRVTSCLGICEVTMVVGDPVAKACAGDVTWMCEVVLDGLDAIDSALSWRNDDLMDQVRCIATARPPCAHRFTRLHKKYKGTECNLWLVSEVGRTEVQARFTLPSGIVEEVIVAQEDGPLYLEDDFPMKTAVVKHGHYILRDRDKNELAQVRIPVEQG